MNQSHTATIKTPSNQSIDIKTTAQITDAKRYTPTYIEARTPHQGLEIITRCDVSQFIDTSAPIASADLIEYLQSRTKIVIDDGAVGDYEAVNALPEMVDHHIAHAAQTISVCHNTKYTKKG